MGIRITRCYRTVSTGAVFVLAGTIPWSLLAMERVKMRSVKESYRAPHDSDEKEGPGPTEAEVREETLREWQARWEQSGGGSYTRSCIPDVKKSVASLGSTAPGAT